MKTSETYFFKIMRQMLQKWVDADNYSKAVKWGQMLDKMMQHLPAEIREMPENIMLYRGVRVNGVAFDKLLQYDKPLILKNRKYSSWTTDLEVAKSFGGGIIPKGLTGVILGRQFQKQVLLLDVNRVAEYLHIANELMQEHEIIVKNSNVNYKFMLKDIIMYKASPYVYRWTKI
jgi:hypothetical protein